MSSWRLKKVWLVGATMGLAACAPQTGQDTAPTTTSTTAAPTTTTPSTTVAKDSVEPAPTSTTAAPTATTSSTTVVEYSVGPTTTTAKLRALRLPGMSPNEPAGEYGWIGEPGSRGWMHKVVERRRGETRQTQLAFEVKDDCFGGGAQGAEPTAVTVAGLDGLYLEPYVDDSVFWSTSHPSGGETTAAYALPIGDRRLCVYLRWDPATTPEELSAARAVVESIRGEPNGDGVIIDFTLPAGWDTG